MWDQDVGSVILIQHPDPILIQYVRKGVSDRDVRSGCQIRMSDQGIRSGCQINELCVCHADRTDQVFLETMNECYDNLPETERQTAVQQNNNWLTLLLENCFRV